jgi:hypothetical protein
MTMIGKLSGSKMDNILKLLLGVLGVAGMIAMVTSNLSFEPQPAPAPVAETVVMQPVPESEDGQEGEEAIAEEGMEDSPEEDGEDIFAIGEPMIDGNPYGANTQPQPQNDNPVPVDMVQNDNPGYAQSAPQSYDPQQYYAPQPSQPVYMPAVAEGQ